MRPSYCAGFAAKATEVTCGLHSPQSHDPLRRRIDQRTFGDPAHQPLWADQRDQGDTTDDYGWILQHASGGSDAAIHAAELMLDIVHRRAELTPLYGCAQA